MSLTFGFSPPGFQTDFLWYSWFCIQLLSKRSRVCFLVSHLEPMSFLHMKDGQFFSEQFLSQEFITLPSSPVLRTRSRLFLTPQRHFSSPLLHESVSSWHRLAVTPVAHLWHTNSHTYCRLHSITLSPIAFFSFWFSAGSQIIYCMWQQHHPHLPDTRDILHGDRLH